MGSVYAPVCVQVHPVSCPVCIWQQLSSGGSGRVLVLLVPGATSLGPSFATSPALTLLAGLSCPTPCSSLRGQHSSGSPGAGTEPGAELLSPGSSVLPARCFHPCQDPSQAAGCSEHPAPVQGVLPRPGDGSRWALGSLPPQTLPVSPGSAAPAPARRGAGRSQELQGWGWGWLGHTAGTWGQHRGTGGAQLHWALHSQDRG